jgi:hypothetical protein
MRETWEKKSLERKKSKTKERKNHVHVTRHLCFPTPNVCMPHTVFFFSLSPRIKMLFPLMFYYSNIYLSDFHIWSFFFHMDMLISYMDELILYVDIYVNWLWNLCHKKLFFTSFFQKCKVIFIFKACFLFSYQMIDLLAIWYLNRSYYSNVEILLFLYNKK